MDRYYTESKKQKKQIQMIAEKTNLKTEGEAAAKRASVLSTTY